MNGNASMSGRPAAPLLFALDCPPALSADVSAALGVSLAVHELRVFEDGEFKARPMQSVRGRDTYVLQDLHGHAGLSVNDRLVRLLFFVAVLRDAGALKVTVVVPYLCFARKDRRTQPRDPVTLRYLAQLFEAVGTEALVVLEVHNPSAFDNAFRCRTCSLDADAAIADRVAGEVGALPVTVMSPDTGGVKRADRFRRVLEQRVGRPVASGFMDKRRSEGVVSGDAVIGDYSGRAVVIIDDMIVTGGTLVRAARACRAAGAVTVIAAATHGVFSAGARVLFESDVVDRVIVTDSLPVPPELGHAGRLSRVPVAPILAACILQLNAAVYAAD